VLPLPLTPMLGLSGGLELLPRIGHDVGLEHFRPRLKCELQAEKNSAVAPQNVPPKSTRAFLLRVTEGFATCRWSGGCESKPRQSGRPISRREDACQRLVRASRLFERDARAPRDDSASKRASRSASVCVAALHYAVRGPD
jgi:hypothetical protein